MHTPVFHALNREMALANQVLGTGITAIRNADLSKNGSYAEAFFNLSIGLERIGKLIFILDYCYSNRGAFPTDKELRNMGHDLLSILNHAKKIRKKYPTTDVLAQLNEDTITKAIFDCLSEFGKGTRYYNLDFVTGAVAVKYGDPINAWFKNVVEPVLAKHYSKKARQKDQSKADLMAHLIGGVALVRFTAEDGRHIDDFGDLTMHAHTTRYANKWAQLYILRIVRFFTILLNDLSHHAYVVRYDFIPDSTDYFGRFYNEDSYFKTRKSWTS